MAMEDAVCLSYHLGHKDSLDAAFTAYQQDRFARTARVQTYSRLMGEYIYHPDGGKAAMRNATMRAMSADDFYDRIEWLYGGSGLSNVSQ